LEVQHDQKEKRTRGKLLNDLRWTRKKLSEAESEPESAQKSKRISALQAKLSETESGLASLNDADGIQTGVGKGKERVRKGQGNGKERAMEGSAHAPGSAESRPASLTDVNVYASEIGMPHAEAEKFYDHFQANGWRQGGRTPLRDWKAACRNWWRRSGEFAPRSAQKNRAGGGAAPEPFNPNLPNAHTGGYPIFNDEPAPVAAPSVESGA
jgi:hypothetical protein